MAHKENEAALTTLIDSNTSVLQAWAESYFMSHIPFMGTREHFFLLVNIYVQPDWTDREKQVSDCLALARIIIGSGLLEDEKAYAQAMEAKTADVLAKKYEGIVCQWPLPPPQ
jgi:hypothetical protein